MPELFGYLIEDFCVNMLDGYHMSDLESLGTQALELTKKLQDLSTELDALKDKLRHSANGNKMHLVIAGLGEITVSKPREGGVKTGVKYSLNEDKLSDDLRRKLLEKDIIVQKDVISVAAKASVSLKLNV